jgi:hypothetical protein
VIVSLALERRGCAGPVLDSFSAAYRINVATSRAQSRVEFVCSPRPLETHCKTVEHMRLANALCRFVELAAPASSR